MRWQTNRDGIRWLEGWASRDGVRLWAAKLGHDLDVWYALVAHGPYKSEMGRCKHCDMPAGWGLIYRGKVGESVGDTSGARRVPVKMAESVREIGYDEEEPDRLVHPLNSRQRMDRGLARKPQPGMWGPALTETCRQLGCR